MRLLLTADAVGGVWHYALDLARGLAAHGTETVLALLGPAPSPAQRAEAAALPRTTLVETGLPLDWLCDGPAPVRAAGAAIADLARATRADLAQLNAPALAAHPEWPVPLVAVAHGCVGTWWDAAHPATPLPPDLAWHRDLVREGLARADRLVAPTAAYAQAVARHYALPRAPHVVHNGRAPLAPPSGSPQDRALTVGRLWDRVKQADLLDRVAARLAIPFDAAGAVTGPHGEHVELRHLVALGELAPAELGARLAARPVFVSAATFEPFGLAVLEAAAAGCALVLSDTAGFRELWDGAARFVPRHDEAAYAAAIEGLVADPAARAALGDAARTRALRYTPAATAAAMHALHADLLAARARAAA